MVKSYQRTKDGMFNATSLLKQWNSVKSNSKRDLDNFWKTSRLTHFMSEVAENELGFKTVNSTALKKHLTKIGRGKYGGTWMHPYLFIKFAMWLNARFEYQVIKFVYDELIKHRHLAGDNYKLFCSAVYSIAPNCDFSEPAKWLKITNPRLIA